MSYIDVVSLVFTIIGVIISLISFHFVFFAIVGLFTYKKYPKAKVQHKYGIIIPARNEEKVVANLIKSVYKNDYPQDKLHVFVIAHNCTDRTAEVSRACGATVYEYNNPDECTMGYAFKHLFKCIEKDFGTQNYDGFFLFNADNILSSNYFEKMNDAFDACEGKNVITSFRNSKNFGTNVMSGLYSMHFICGCRFESRGRTVLGCSTRVQGTGYVINSNIVKDGWPYVTLTEDWEFSADQILRGNKIQYCDEAVFFDEQPTTVKVMFRQRIRWAKGCLLVFFQKSKCLLTNLFKKSNKHKMSTYDIWVNTLPTGIISFVVVLLQVIMLAISPLFGENILDVFLSSIKSVGITVGIGYLITMLSVALAMIVERKRIKSHNFFLKLGVALCWPIFSFLTLPIAIIALFSKNVVWKTIPHEDETNFEMLNHVEANVEVSIETQTSKAA